jgi:hypothetical protein
MQSARRGRPKGPTRVEWYRFMRSFARQSRKRSGRAEAMNRLAPNGERKTSASLRSHLCGSANPRFAVAVARGHFATHVVPPVLREANLVSRRQPCGRSDSRINAAAAILGSLRSAVAAPGASARAGPTISAPPTASAAHLTETRLTAPASHHGASRSRRTRGQGRKTRLIQPLFGMRSRCVPLRLVNAR